MSVTHLTVYVKLHVHDLNSTTCTYKTKSKKYRYQAVKQNILINVHSTIL